MFSGLTVALKLPLEIENIISVFHSIHVHSNHVGQICNVRLINYVNYIAGIFRLMSCTLICIRNCLTKPCLVLGSTPKYSMRKFNKEPLNPPNSGEARVGLWRICGDES